MSGPSQLRLTDGSVRQDFLGLGRKSSAPKNVLGKRSEPKCKPGNKRCGGACVPAFRNGTKTLCKDEIELAQKKSLKGRMGQAKSMLKDVRRELNERLMAPEARKKLQDDREIDAELKAMKRDKAWDRAQQARRSPPTMVSKGMEEGILDVGKRRVVQAEREQTEEEFQNYALNAARRRAQRAREKKLEGLEPGNVALGLARRRAQRSQENANAPKWKAKKQDAMRRGDSMETLDWAASVLGIRSDSLLEMDSAALRKHYRTLAFQHHPDRGGRTATMADINNAFDTIVNLTHGDSLRTWFNIAKSQSR